MSRFVSAEIEPLFDETPALKKRTGCPDGFVWEGQHLRIVELLAEWHDYAKQREPGQTRRTQVQLDRQRGGWGTGRDYYRVRTHDGRIWELYYDRRPRSREVIGCWVLYRELDETDELLL